MKFQTRIAASVASVLLVAFASPSFAGQANAPITAVTPLPILDRSIQVGHADQFQKMYVTVSMPFADSAAMEQFAESVSDPNSPNYRHFITPEQVGERFGISQERVQAISDYLQSQGLTVTMVAKNRLTVSCEGTLEQVETAFGTTIDQYVIDPLITKGEPDGGNVEFIAPSTELNVPAHIVNDIIGVSGIETYTKPMHRAILTPTQTRTLYNEAPLYAAGTQGQGRTIGISNWDGYRLTNVPLYYTKYALPTPAGGVGSNVHEVKISGGAGTGTAGGEGDLDIQMVLGMAPLCEFYIYDGGASDLIGVLTREVNDNLCDVLSESWGWNLTSATWTPAHNLHLSMSAQGITYMAASGDTGVALGVYDYPNYDGEVLMVGGTTATATTAGARSSEIGWSGSGGGWSTKTATFNTRPSWQVGTGVPTTINYRLSPDLAFHSSSTTGAYYFYFNGALTSGYTGTSFACPVFAGMLGVAQQKIIALGGLPANSASKRRMGRIQNLIYSQNGRTDVWYDITSGSNGTLPNGATSSCTAKWDYVTGWGCMDMNAFVTTQNPLFTITTPNGVPTFILPSGGTTMDVTITPINGTVAAGSQKLFYKDSAASTWSSAPLLPKRQLNDYVATFPAASCNSTLQFYVQVTSTSSITVTLPTGGASTPYSATAAISSAVVLSDDFDGTSSAFTVGASGDTATAGTWVRSAVLNGCGANTVSYSGTKAWVTGSGGCVDVDGGKTSLLSPVVDATGADALDLSYAIFLSYNGGTPTDDPLQVFVSNDGGSTWVLAASYTTATGTNIWSLKKVSVLNYVGATNQMRVKFVAQDIGTDNVVEAGIDSVSFTSVVCNNTVYGDFNGDLVVDAADVGLMLLDFGVCPGCPTDLDGSGDVDSADIGLELLEIN